MRSRSEAKRLTILQGQRADHSIHKWQESLWLSIALLTPLFVNFWVEQQFEASKIWLLRTLIWLLAMLWLSGWATGLHARRLPASIRGGLFALILAFLLSTLFSDSRFLALFGSLDRANGALTQLSYLLLFVCVATQIDDQRSQRLLRVIVLTALPICLLGLAQGLGWQPLPLWSDARSPVVTTLGRANFTGAYLALLLPLTLTAMQVGRGWPRRGFAVLAVLELLVIALTQARAAWIAACFGVWLLWWLRAAPGWSRRVRWLSVLGSFSLVGGALLLILQRGIASGGSIAARWTIWQAALRLLRERPWFGYGADTLVLHFPAVYPPQLVYYQGRGVVVDRAHNWLLDWSLNHGITGAFIFAALVCFVLRAGWQRLSYLAASDAATSAEQRNEGRWLAACMAAVGTQLVGNLFLFEVAATAVIFWLLMAVIVAASAGENWGTRRHSQTVRRIKFTVAILAIFILSWLIGQSNVRPLLADWHSWRGTQALGQGEDSLARTEYAHRGKLPATACRVSRSAGADCGPIGEFPRSRAVDAEGHCAASDRSRAPRAARRHLRAPGRPITDSSIAGDGGEGPSRLRASHCPSPNDWVDLSTVRRLCPAHEQCGACANAGPAGNRARRHGRDGLWHFGLVVLAGRRFEGSPSGLFAGGQMAARFSRFLFGSGHRSRSTGKFRGGPRSSSAEPAAKPDLSTGLDTAGTIRAVTVPHPRSIMLDHARSCSTKGEEMKSKSYLPQVFVIATIALLLGGLGAQWPRWVGASPLSIAAPGDVIGDAITYQGYLTDDQGAPLTGTFSIVFDIYNDPAAGDLLWSSGALDIPVENGLFATRLEIATDVFNGEALWIAHAVDGETLAPRLEILPAPMAHTLRPGAIMKGTANAFPNNYMLDVQMNNDTFAFNRGAIAGQTTTGNAIYGLANAGRAIYGQTQDGYGIYGFDGGSEANRGYAGYFYSTNGIGVYGYSGADRSHPNIYAPGVYGQSNQGVGVYGRGDTSDSHTFFNEGGYFVGGKGLYARGTDSALEAGYGARIYSTNYHGMYVQGAGGAVDAYFGGSGGISTNGLIDRSGGSQSLAVNLGEESIEPGDLVALAGVATSPEADQPMLGVAKVDAQNRSAVIGVAVEAMAVETMAVETIAVETTALEDQQEAVNFVHVAGAIAPGSHLVLITEGLAPAVNVSSLAAAAGWSIGHRIALSTSGDLVRASGAAGSPEVEATGVEADGVDGVALNAIEIGKVASPVDEASGTVALFIDID